MIQFRPIQGILNALLASAPYVVPKIPPFAGKHSTARAGRHNAPGTKLARKAREHKLGAHH